MDADANHRHWAERSGEFSPTYYAQLGPNKVSRRLVDVVEAYIDEQPVSILELGCSSGRHLAHFLDQGFEDLHGIDLNDESFAVMDDYFPDLVETGLFRTGSIEDVVSEYPESQFDVVYSVETLQHVHPDNKWVFDELARITSDLLVTVENEGDRSSAGDSENGVRLVNGEFPIYYRNWKQIFTDCGLIALKSASCGRDTIRVFQYP